MTLLDDTTKRQWQRLFRRRRKEVEKLSLEADSRLESLFVRRLERLISVRRFVFLWISLFGLLFFSLFLQLRGLRPYYQELKPVSGGMYSEGLIGTFTNASPLYATNSADVAISRLVFSGLLKYDRSNQLVGDLAEGYKLDASETQYTVSLKHGVKWQDGKPFTADDVVFSYQAIQDPAAQSPLLPSWQSIRITKQDNYTVVFNLPNALSSFPHALTNGIVPKHLLGGMPAASLRSAGFNTAPVGSGPFKWKFVEVTGTTSATRQQRITLAANDGYYGGRPKIDGFTLRTFPDDKSLIAAFAAKQLNGIGGLERVPDQLHQKLDIQTYLTPLTSSTMAFFNNSHDALNNTNFRKALVSGIDRAGLIKQLTYPGNMVDEPLLRGQLGYDQSLAELPYNPAYANQILDELGWKRDAAGQRIKDGKALSFGIASQDNQNYTIASQYLQKQWSQLGIKVEVRFYNAEDLHSSIIVNHNYDVLLYGIGIGVDPDVFAYWDSSQAAITSQGRLNLSEYKSKAADAALESARTRSDPAQRALKSRPFLTAWRDDAPALALYQPQYLYITRGPIFGYSRAAINAEADRFYNVTDWTVREQWQNL